MMKRAACMLLILSLALSACAALADTAIDETNFPDPAFREIVQGFDKNNDGTLSDKEAKAVRKLECAGMGIRDLTGIQAFTALKNLNVEGNLIGSLDVSALGELQELICKTNPLTELNVSGAAKLQHLDCEGTFMTALDLSGCPALNDLCVTNMASLKDLSLFHNPKMIKLWTLGSGLTSVKIGSCPELIKVYEQGKSNFGDGYIYADSSWKHVLVVNGNAEVITSPEMLTVRAESVADFRGSWTLYCMTIGDMVVTKDQLKRNNTSITCTVTDKTLTMKSGSDKAVADIELNEADGSLKTTDYDGSVNYFFLLEDGTMASVYNGQNGESIFFFSKK